MRILLLIALMVMSSLAVCAAAEVETALHEYIEGEVTLEGFVAWDASISSLQPVVLIVHQWRGISDHERNIAVKLAEAGYVAFCADIYGKGVRPETPQDAGRTAGLYRSGDRAIFRGRLSAALNAVQAGAGKFPAPVDPNRVVVIGYCFGGTGALEMARMNADVLGAVSFHGGLTKGEGLTAEVIKPKILVLHGDADPLVPPAEVAGLQEELRAAQADWELVAYGGAVHSFTDRNANSASSRYDPKADARSWARLHDFLREVFER